MGRTACTEPQCLYKSSPYLYLIIDNTEEDKKAERKPQVAFGAELVKVMHNLGGRYSLLNNLQFF